MAEWIIVDITNLQKQDQCLSTNYYYQHENICVIPTE